MRTDIPSKREPFKMEPHLATTKPAECLPCQDCPLRMGRWAERCSSLTWCCHLPQLHKLPGLRRWVCSDSGGSAFYWHKQSTAVATHSSGTLLHDAPKHSRVHRPPVQAGSPPLWGASTHHRPVGQQKKPTPKQRHSCATLSCRTDIITSTMLHWETLD